MKCLQCNDVGMVGMSGGRGETFCDCALGRHLKEKADEPAWMKLNENARKLWSEDDATYNCEGHEGLEMAWERIFGEKYPSQYPDNPERHGALDVYDGGDCTFYRFADGRIACSSYPGNNEIWLEKGWCPDCFKELGANHACISNVQVITPSPFSKTEFSQHPAADAANQLRRLATDPLSPFPVPMVFAEPDSSFTPAEEKQSQDRLAPKRMTIVVTAQEPDRWLEEMDKLIKAKIDDGTLNGPIAVHVEDRASFPDRPITPPSTFKRRTVLPDGTPVKLGDEDGLWLNKRQVQADTAQKISNFIAQSEAAKEMEKHMEDFSTVKAGSIEDDPRMKDLKEFIADPSRSKLEKQLVLTRAYGVGASEIERRAAEVEKQIKERGIKLDVAKLAEYENLESAESFGQVTPEERAALNDRLSVATLAAETSPPDAPGPSASIAALTEITGHSWMFQRQMDDTLGAYLSLLHGLLERAQKDAVEPQYDLTEWDTDRNFTLQQLKHEIDEALKLTSARVVQPLKMVPYDESELAAVRNRVLDLEHDVAKTDVFASQVILLRRTLVQVLPALETRRSMREAAQSAKDALALTEPGKPIELTRRCLDCGARHILPSGSKDGDCEDQELNVFRKALGDITKLRFGNSALAHNTIIDIASRALRGKDYGVIEEVPPPAKRAASLAWYIAGAKSQSYHGLSDKQIETVREEFNTLWTEMTGQDPGPDPHLDLVVSAGIAVCTELHALAWTIDRGLIKTRVIADALESIVASWHTLTTALHAVGVSKETIHNCNDPQCPTVREGVVTDYNPPNTEPKFKVGDRVIVKGGDRDGWIVEIQVAREREDGWYYSYSFNGDKYVAHENSFEEIP